MTWRGGGVMFEDVEKVPPAEPDVTEPTTASLTELAAAAAWDSKPRLGDVRFGRGTIST